jgi:phosphoribosylformimino-5-aminoimidazole carboxamide ribotide isomerase
MELIPVLDLARGVAVHAVGGDRSRYPPVRSVLVPGVEGDALALARAYRAIPGVLRCYVADLDAIAGRPPQLELLQRLQSGEGFGGPVLLDAGLASPDRLDQLQGASAQVIVGLETLRSFADLGRIAGRTNVTFSLDLRNDAALALPPVCAEAGSAEPVDLARAALDAGARSLILLDVGRVGRGVGVNLELLSALRRALPGTELLAGGGVRGEEDLTALAGHGCDGVLIATALHQGTIGSWSPQPGQSRASEVR